MKKAPKSPEFVKTDPKDSDPEDTIRSIKEEEEPVFKKGRYKGQKTSSYLKKILRSSGIEKRTKEATKRFLKQKH